MNEDVAGQGGNEESEQPGRPQDPVKTWPVVPGKPGEEEDPQ